MARREIPVDAMPASLSLHHSRPLTEIEALMTADPIRTPMESIEELQPFREAVAECMEQLDEQDLFIIEALTSEMVSLQTLATRLGMTKTHAWRLRNKAYDKLQRIMITHPTIRRRIKVADTWEQSAGQWVTYMAQNATQLNIVDIERLGTLRDRAHKYLKIAQDPPHSIWAEMASLAIEELRLMGLWDTAEMTHTLARKQHDYGHGNIDKFGLMGVLVRISDKVERYKNLSEKNNKAMNEAIEDTLMDIVGYCVIAMMLCDLTFHLELGPEWSTQ